MCEHGQDVKILVYIPADLSHTGFARWGRVSIDECIAPLVSALSLAGIQMRASCCGHGKGDGAIDLQDGRTLVIRPTERLSADIVEHEAALLDQLQASLHAASEERLRNQLKASDEARKWMAEGEWYGFNFHEGMAAGMNWADIIYSRVARECRAFRTALEKTRSHPR